ncbi:conserved hypothetical protein [Photobacterium leiognathi lrivu.4.1]|uniref:Uncharacterized protein n=1 Tax=Photobacterium leiognathi lrivu.4.1 TaxID=1248232 RepID=V5H436_PHOLE|nr:hypothetical protein PMSV_2865 [Photobacterium leiognathi subsp. mandapamensis svers.1.1.]GAD31812.1 conserved hypothetical protein [Photobacterium leiognathi lrivu.4.1]
MLLVNAISLPTDFVSADLAFDAVSSFTELVEEHPTTDIKANATNAYLLYLNPFFKIYPATLNFI